MAISPQYGTAVYNDSTATQRSANSPVAGKRTKVANSITSAATGIAVTTGVGVAPPTALNTDVYTGPNSANGTTVAGKPAAGSLNVNSTPIGKAVYGGVYS